MDPPPVLRPLIVSIDLSGREFWERREWENLLAQASPEAMRIQSHPQGADCELAAGSPYQFRGAPPPPLWKTPAARGIPRFVWDFDDAPMGCEPGLYCSLPRFLFDPRRHRTFCYPLTYNETVQAFDLTDADRLFGFCGAISSGLRQRMIDGILRGSRPEERLIAVQGGPWNAMYDRSGLAVKKEFAEILRRGRFSLCPRGNGVASIRLFETMKAARVPVILSDEYVLPAGIDWERCAVLVQEKDILDLPRILRAKQLAWAEMAVNARSVWEENFAENRLFGPLSRHLRALLASARPLGWGGKLRIAAYPPVRKFSTAATRGRQALGAGLDRLWPASVGRGGSTDEEPRRP